jgi:hypothetical protein
MQFQIITFAYVQNYKKTQLAKPKLQRPLDPINHAEWIVRALALSICSKFLEIQIHVGLSTFGSREPLKLDPRTTIHEMGLKQSPLFNT